MDSFIKNPQILEEDFKVIDLLDFSNITTDFKLNLEKIKTNSVVGLIGRFGSGKSTMLYQLYKDNKDEVGEKWINFDAWKFPERKDLWEGFVLEVAKCLDKKLFDKARKKIDGKQHSDIKSLISVISKGANIFLPGASIAENFNSLFNSSPAKRVFEFQEMLHDLIKETKKDIYIIVEDIDRSGDKGIFFLETLRNFIKTNKFSKKVVIIVPIGTPAFEKEKDADSYGKSLDYHFDFKTSNIDFKNFIKNLFTDDFLKTAHSVERMDLLFRQIFSQRNITIRQLKTIIRIADVEYQKLPETEKELNPEIFLLFTALRFFNSIPNHFVNGRRQITDSNLGYHHLIWIANADDIPDERNLQIFTGAKLNISLVEDQNYNVPTLVSDLFANSGQNKNQYSLTNKYSAFLGIR